MKVIVHKGVSHKVPCGSCAFCLVNKRSQWMFRIYHEMKNQDQPGWFITLTYDEKHVKRVGSRLSLRFRDVQLFLKRVRKAKYYCKYICVGEYGGKTQRPHYHMLLWTDCPVMDLERFWRQGSIHFGRITMQSAMYTLKYIIQPKQKAVDGIEKTRAQFSKGLGLSYLTTEVYEWHTQVYDDPVFYSYLDGSKVALPRYYTQKIFTKHQMAVNREKLFEESMTERAKLVRKALALGAGCKGKRVTIDKRLKLARAWLLQLRSVAADRIIEKTKSSNQII